jgi:hypothetical protein
MTFSDYSRNAIRMAALMQQRVIHVLTHDSIGLGEDGPTHQPVEHAASLRLIPNNHLWRPCDGVETAVAWQAAIARFDGPTCLVLSRQGLTPFERSAAQVQDIARGGYVLIEHSDQHAASQLVLIATGSEVEIAALAAVQLGRSRRDLVLARRRGRHRHRARHRQLRRIGPGAATVPTLQAHTRARGGGGLDADRGQVNAESTSGKSTPGNSFTTQRRSPCH